MTTPSGQVITYGYTNGKITGISVNGTVLVSDILYDPFGPVRQWTWGNGSLAVRTFDQDGKIAQIDSAGLKTYSYDDAFRITGITDTSDPALSWTYGYDDLDRLTNASKTGTTLGYTYDANGNRLAETGSNPSTFTIAANSNRLASTSGTLSRTYGYDDAGNATSFTGVSFTYNNRGRMKSSTKDGATTNYVYNALGQLVKKGSTALYYYDEAGHILGIYDGTGALTEEIVWLGDIPIATLRPNGGGIDIYYIHTDHLNTPRLVTGSVNPDVRWRWDGDPFGGGAINDNPSGAGVFEFNLRFPGQLAIAETGLYYNYFRDYDPQTGRYVESDPIGLEGGVNTYGYVGGNPIQRTDETAEAWQAPLLYCARFPKICRNVYDCFRNPQACKQKFCRAGNALYHPVCDNATCRVGEDCNVTKIKSDFAQGCLAFRVATKRICYKNQPDRTHDDQIDNARRKVRICRAMERQNCAGCGGEAP
jgi:RHS repeat-associated protein